MRIIAGDCPSPCLAATPCPTDAIPAPPRLTKLVAKNRVVHALPPS